MFSSDEERGQDPFLPARKQKQGRTRVRGKSKGRQVNFGGELEVDSSSKPQPGERKVEAVEGEGRKGSINLLEQRIQTLEVGTTASLARIEHALSLLASKK